jgi:hypothetical protein
MAQLSIHQRPEIMNSGNSSTMIYTEADNRRESWIAGGWNIRADDDASRPPEVDPLASAQARRYWRLPPANRPEGEVHGRHIPHQRT